MENKDYSDKKCIKLKTDDYKDIIIQTLNLLYKKEKKLYEVHVHERCLVFHFGKYFIDVLNDINFDLDYYSVDCEYNKDEDTTKKLKSIEKENIENIIYPDLILHSRGKKDNILVIEFKWDNNNNKNDDKNDNVKKDRNKLEALTQGDNYNYKMGLLIFLNQENNYKIELYKNGEKSEEYTNGIWKKIH